MPVAEKRRATRWRRRRRPPRRPPDARPHGRREHRRHGHPPKTADAEEKRQTLRQHPRGDGPGRLGDQEAEAAGERRAERDMHGRLRPPDARTHAAEPPDHEGPDSAEQPEVLEPVESGGDEIGWAAQAATEMIPPPRARSPEYSTAPWPSAAPREASARASRPPS